MIKNSNFFSIIVPAYNCEKFLSECLESIRNQSYKDIEVIIIDDGSTDCTPTILDEIADVDLRFKVIHQANSGTGEARNRGIEEAKGDYILFVDSDDILVGDCLERVYNTIDKYNSPDLIVFGNKTFGYGEEVISSKPFKIYNKGADYVREIVNAKGGAGSVWGRAYKASIIRNNNIRFGSFKTAEDGHFNTLYLCYLNSVVNIEYIGYMYRKADYYVHSLSNFFKREKFFESSVDSCARRLEVLRKSMKIHGLTSAEDMQAYYDGEWYSFSIVNIENSIYNPRLINKIKCEKKLLTEVLSRGSLKKAPHDWKYKILLKAYNKKSGLLLFLWNYCDFNFFKNMIIYFVAGRMLPKESLRGRLIRKIIKK